MKERNALVVAFSEESRSAVSSAVMEAGIENVSVSSGNGIRELLSEKSYYIVILVLPLENEFGLELAAHIRRSTESALVLIVPSKTYDNVSRKAAELSVQLLPKNSPRGLIVSTVRTAVSQRARLDELREENSTLRDMVSEMKLVNRAKCVLIEYLRIPEKEAHRQIQKRAMDHRITLTEVAMDIIKTYEYR